MRNAYRPRRASKRWLDGDCPAGVLAIFDNGGKTIDRYTVIYADPIVEDDGSVWIGLRDMSADPFHPQGYGVWNSYPAHVIAEWRYRNSRHAARWSDLPDAVKHCVRLDIDGTN